MRLLLARWAAPAPQRKSAPGRQVRQQPGVVHQLRPEQSRLTLQLRLHWIGQVDRERGVQLQWEVLGPVAAAHASTQRRSLQGLWVRKHRQCPVPGQALPGSQVAQG